MIDLEKYITGYWFDIKESAENLYNLEEQFSFSGAQLKSIADEIRFSVEEGIVEYKRSPLLPLFSFLESFKYDSREIDHLENHSYRLAQLIYVILIQRLLARGTIPLHREELNVEIDVEQDIKVIIQDVNRRIKENPELNKNRLIKNILMQMNIYKKELDKMQNLAPNIKPELASSFFANFRKTFDSINESIRENYREFLEEEQLKRDGKSVRDNPLAPFDLTPIARVCSSQAKEVAEVKATVDFVAKERFKMRESLANVLKRKDDILRPIQEEWNEYERMSREVTTDKVDARSLSKAFGSEVVRVLEKQHKS